MGRPAQPGIAFLVVKQRLPVFEQQHMHMHTAPRFLINRFRKEGSCLALLRRHIFNNIFDNHGIVCHSRHIRQLYLYFHLSGPTYFMMMIFYFNAPIFHHHTHPAAQIIAHILWRRHMITTLIRHLIPVVACCIQAAVPVRLPCVNPVPALLRRYLITGAVKQIKFKFGPDYHPIRNTAFLHIFHCPQAYILRILVKRLVFPFPYRAYIPTHRQCGNRRKRIHIRGFRIRQKNHIALFNRGISIIRAVKSNAIGEGILPETLHGNRNMPPSAVDIRHLKVYHTDLFLFT